MRKLKKHGNKAEDLNNIVNFILERKKLMYTFLDKINYPSDLKNLRKKDLPKVSEELRKELIDVVSETGGHLGAGLGVVELTVALHYVLILQKIN